MASRSDIDAEIARLRHEIDVAQSMVMRQAAEIADLRAEIAKLRTLPPVVVDATRKIRDVINSLTARGNDLRKMQHTLIGAGLDEWGRAVETIADRIELTFGVLARVRNRLGVSATGSAEDTLTRATTGEWAVPPEVLAHKRKR